MDLSQIDAEHDVKGGPNIKGGRVDLFGLDARPGQPSDRFCASIVQSREQDLELAVTVQHLCLVDVVEFQRMGQCEDMCVTVVAHQCLADRPDGSMDSYV